MEGNEERTLNFFESKQEAFCIFSREGAFSFYSAATPNILQLKEADMVSRTLFELTVDDDVSTLKEAFGESEVSGESSVEVRIKGAKELWISWNLFLADNSIYAVGRDVTHVYADKKTLETAQNRLRLLHQATANPNQTLSEKIERVLNLGNLQLGMQTALVSKVLDGEFEVAHVKSSDSKIQKGNVYRKNETFDSITLETGNLVGIRNMANSVFAEHPAREHVASQAYIAIPLYVDGEIKAILSFSHDAPLDEDFDITDYDLVRLIGQEVSSALALLQANEQIAYTAAIVSSSEDAIIGQNKEGIITTWNKGAETLLQYTAEEIIGKHFSVTMPFDRKEEADSILSQLERGENLGHYDSVRLKKDGTTVEVSVAVSPILNEEKEIIGASSVIRDITREKQIDRAKTEFVSLASHQLRTPLSAINWYAELLRDGEAGKLNPQQREFIDEIFLGNKRMVRLVNELLNVSRVDFGNFSIDPEQTDIVEISKSVIKELTPKILEKKLKIVEEYESDSMMYLADPNIFRIIIQNLVSNAVKYTPPKGKVVVRMKYKPRENMLFIEVVDNGYGIPKDQQDQIFQKLFRAENVQSMDTEGTGLGLYVLKSSVEESGGTVDFDSVENEGTTFRVHLPASGMKPKEGGKSLSQATP